MPLDDTVPRDRPGDMGRRIRDLERALVKLNARLTPSTLPLTTSYAGTPLVGAYDPTRAVAQLVTHATGTTSAAGTLSVPLGDTMTSILAAELTELRGASGTALKVYVRTDLTAADVVVVEARSLVDGSVAASAAVDVIVTTTYQA